MEGHIFRTAFLLLAVIVVVVSPESWSENEHSSSELAVEDTPLFLRAVDAVGGALAITSRSLSGFIFSSASDTFCMSTDEMLDAFGERVQVVVRQEMYLFMVTLGAFGVVALCLIMDYIIVKKLVHTISDNPYVSRTLSVSGVFFVCTLIGPMRALQLFSAAYSLVEHAASVIETNPYTACAIACVICSVVTVIYLHYSNNRTPFPNVTNTELGENQRAILTAIQEIKDKLEEIKEQQKNLQRVVASLLEK